MTAATLWKGKAIRAQLAVMGEGWDKLHPEVKKKAVDVLADANREFAKDGLQVGIFEGYRSTDRQNEVINSGNSFVASALRSYHPWGLAVDFVFLTGPGLWTWEPKGGRADWDRLGAIIEKHGFEWGGRWKSFDGPHAQWPLERSKTLIAKYKQPATYAQTWA